MILLLFLTLFSTVLLPEEPVQRVTIALPVGLVPLLVKLPQKTFRLGSLHVRADCALDADELRYLLPFHSGDLVTAHDLAQGLRYLAKKNKFESATLIYQQRPQATDLSIELVSRWTFKRLKVTGMAVGKDQIVQHYELEPGDPFYEKKHQYGVEKIKKSLQEQGFLSATLQDTLVRDQATKEVTATLQINRGKKFIIGQIQVLLAGVVPAKTDALRLTLEERMADELAGRRYHHEVVEASITHLTTYLAQQGFIPVTVEATPTLVPDHHRVNLTFSLTLPARRFFVFQGAYHLGEDELRAALIGLGHSAQLLPPPLLADELLRMYHAQGFDQATIEVQELGDQTHFIITEGERARVQAIHLRGVTIGGTDELVQHFFPPLNTFYQESAVTESVEQLLDWYREQGFRDVRVIERSWNLHTLTIYLDEGPRYLLQQVLVPGYRELEAQIETHLQQSVSFCPKTVHLAPERPFTDGALATARRMITEYFIKRGNLFATSSCSLAIEPRNGMRLVTARWQCDPGVPVSLGKAVIAGVNPVPFYFISRELQWQPGAAWQKEKVDTSALKLRELDIFETIHCVPEIQTVPAAQKAIMLRAIPYDPFEVRLRAGLLGIAKNLTWREGATYKVGGSFLYRNVAGYGGQFRLDGDLFKFEQRIAASYRHPWLFGLPYRTTVKGYYNRYIQPVVIGKRLPLYVALQQGCLVSLSRKFSPITFGFSSGFEWLETEVKNAHAARAINFVPQLNKVQIPYWFIEPTLVLDFLDNKVYPSSGSFTLISGKGMLPFKRVTPFLKVLVEQTFFVPFARVLVGGFRFRAGHVFSTRFNQIMPPDRFFLGGAHSVRGYEPDHVPPLGTLCDPDTGKNILVPQGGRTMANVNIELRFPLYKKLSGVVFQDVGLLLGDEGVSVVKERAVAGSGLGLRYNTPIGPLRLDVGMKWRKSYPQDSRFAWYLTLDNFF